MLFSPYYIIIAVGCFAGAAIMFTRLRDQAAVTVPAGILLTLGGIYILCREFIKGFADSAIVSYAARGVLVVFLIYLLLTYNNLRAERSAEFDEPSESLEEIESKTEEPSENDGK